MTGARELPYVVASVFAALLFALTISLCATVASAQEEVRKTSAVTSEVYPAVTRARSYLDAIAPEAAITAQLVDANGTWTLVYPPQPAGVQSPGNPDYPVDGLSVTVGEDVVVDWGGCSDILVWASVMRLVERGQLSLGARIGSYLSDATYLPEGYEKLTILDLMNHTTGLNVASGAFSPSAEGSSALTAIRAFDVRPSFEIGELVAYSAFDAMLAACVIESVTETDVCSFITQEILDPLGLDSTAVSIGLTPVQMAASQDERLSRVASAYAAGSSSSVDYASALGVVSITCLSTINDMSRLCVAMLGDSSNKMFEEGSTYGRLYETSRTYPSLGTRRIAHGLFALPLRPDAVGMASSGNEATCALYLDWWEKSAAVVVLAVPDREPLVQGVAGQMLGPAGLPATQDEAAPVFSGSEQSVLDDLDWAGVYQDASLPDSGASKLISALNRTRVTLDESGEALLINGEETTLLGKGVYATAEPDGNDPYRFHVGLARGLEFSRATCDSYAVSRMTYTLELALIYGAMASAAFSLFYALACWASILRSGAHGKRWNGQTTCLLLAMGNVAMTAMVAFPLLGGESVYAAMLQAIRISGAVFAPASLFGLVWLAVTRWRGTARESHQLAAAVAVGLSAAILMLNLVYWEMLL